MNERPYLYISATIFCVVGVLHLARAMMSVPVRIGTNDLPMLMSWVGGVVALVLGVWALRLAVKRAG